MPSIQYLNQSAPFWDFIADLEEQGNSHPFFANPGQQQPRNDPHAAPGSFEHMSGAWGNFPWSANIPHRDHRGSPPLGNNAERSGAEPSDNVPPAENSDSSDEDHSPRPPHPPAGDSHHHRGGRHGHHAHGRDHRRHSPGPFGHGHHRHGPGPCRRGRGGHRGRGGFHPRDDFHNPFQPLADGLRGFNSWFGIPSPTPAESANTITSFVPDIDVFDTPDSFVVHVSLPGARKEDLGVSWDSEKSELAVAGVVHRPGDEALLRHLALNERRVGEFERKVRLGSRARPAQVDADAIAARMEDGILRVDVPKLDAGYVEVHKVDVD